VTPAQLSLQLHANIDKSLSGDTVAIVIGPQEEMFYVHEAILRKSSPFFDKAIGGGWKESAERIVRLPSEPPEIMRIYVYWLYYGGILMPDKMTMDSRGQTFGLEFSEQGG
jgi:hypothetical protein